MTLLSSSISDNITLVPLEGIKQNVMSHLLSGEAGTNRASKATCQLSIDDDLSAIYAWLNEFKAKPTTYRAYQKEAERLLLWCLHQQQKPISSLKREDFETYVAFLENPQPRHQWCGKKGGRGKTRGAPGWRPFVSGLSFKTIQNTLTIINSMLTYWVDAGYLLQNPLKLMKRLRCQPTAFEERKLDVQQRILEPDEWQAFIDTLENLPETDSDQKDEKERLRFIVHMLFFLGLRVGELTSHTWSAFRQIQSQWWFVVKGKGDKVGKIPVNDQLWKTVLRFRCHLGYSLVPDSEDMRPLIPSWRSDESLQARHINNLLKNLAEQASQQISTQPQKAAKLKKLSAHWLRHQSATMQSRAGISEVHIQENHRHGSRETTRIYIHSYDQERHEAIKKLKLE